jgi:hypothetical protein
MTTAAVLSIFVEPTPCGRKWIARLNERARRNLLAVRDAGVRSPGTRRRDAGRLGSATSIESGCQER